MNPTYENIVALCKEKGTSYNAVCKKCGVSPSAVGNLKSNPNRQLGTGNAAKIAKELGVTVDDLLGKQKNPVTLGDGELTAEQKELIQKVMKMDAQSLSAARPVIESLLFAQQARDGQQ